MKIVVVVEGKTIFFEGEDLQIADCGTPKLLVIKDTKRVKAPISMHVTDDVVLAVFKHWDYWLLIEKPTNLRVRDVDFQPKNQRVVISFKETSDTLRLTKDGLETYLRELNFPDKKHKSIADREF